MNVTHIHTTTAKAAYADLLNSLGTENNPNQWMVFMDAVERHLPIMSGSGRPTKAEIESSVIGQLGFNSWSALVETPVADGGLGWSINSWKLWVKAWAIVKRHPYLREQQITASMLMKHKAEFGEHFPATAEDLSVAIDNAKQQKQLTANATVATLKDEVAKLEKALIASNAKLERLALLEQEHSELQQAHTALQIQNQVMVSQLEQLEKSRKPAKETSPKPTGFWQKLRWLLSK